MKNKVAKIFIMLSSGLLLTLVASFMIMEKVSADIQKANKDRDSYEAAIKDREAKIKDAKDKIAAANAKKNASVPVPQDNGVQEVAYVPATVQTYSPPATYTAPAPVYVAPKPAPVAASVPAPAPQPTVRADRESHETNDD